VAIDVIRGLAGTQGESRLAGVGGPSRRRLMTLAAAEIALTMTLLAGAGLVLRSVIARLMVDQGFETRGALAMQISLPPPAYPTPATRADFHRRLLEHLQRHPGVDSVGLAASMPNRQPTGRFDFSATPVAGPPVPFSDTVAEVRMVTEGFAEAMGLRLIAGRTFGPRDVDGTEQVIVISDRLARQHFAGVDAVGRVLYSRTGDRRVIGVVADVRPLSGADPQAAAYLPLWQNPEVLEWLSGMHVVVRGRDAPALAPSLRALVLSLDPAVPPYNVRTLDADVARIVAGPRFAAWLLSFFAAAALAMSAIAIYGVMAYSARLRTREIGVRVALGSTRLQAMQVIITEALVAIGAGVGVGLLLSIGVASSLGSAVADLPALDAPTMLAITALLLTVAVSAAALPARRAARRPPLEAIRTD
jgi:putative ABC transport system permease protein